MEKSTHKKTIWICILAVMLAAGIFVFAGKAGGVSAEEEEASIKNAVARAALQCYVIEGTYPESLDHLTEHYGLAVNTRDYKIVYSPFAENLPPDIRVIRRSD